MLNNVYEEKMDKTISVFEENLSEIRAGRANPAILNKITVSYYGVPTPINQVAGISVPEARMILIQPWDTSLLKEIEKEILKSDIGINPNNDGKVIRLNFPELNEERRKELVKDIRKLAEEAKVAIRSIRRDAMDEAKEMAMQMMPDIPDTMFVLTNDTKVNGAAAILNDDIRQEIAEKVGDFYMLPSSIHETLIIPKDAGMEFKELEQMVQEVNQTQVAPGERLSDHVYEYDAKEHELFRSDRAEERAKQKEEKGDNRHERVSVKEKLAEKKDAVIKMNAGKEHSAPEKKKEAVI